VAFHKKMSLGIWDKGNHKGWRDNLEDLGVDGRTMLECILGRWEEVVDWMHLAQERGSEPLGSIKGMEFLY
jgi:hypothetical protein